MDLGSDIRPVTREPGELMCQEYAERMSSTATDTRLVGSIVAGERRADGRRIESRNPAHLDDVVAEAALADVATFVDACRAARAAQAGLGGNARAGARRRDPARSAAWWSATRRRWPGS